MKYILYFDGYDNDTYFYDTLEELLENWDYKDFEDFINHYKDYYKGVAIFKIEKVLFDSDNLFELNHVKLENGVN